MDTLSEIFIADRELIYIFFLVVLLELTTGWLKAKTSDTLYAMLNWQGLWKKLSHFVLLILTGIVDFVLLQDGIYFEFTLVKIFTSYLIFTEIGSIIENIAETEVTVYFRKVLKLVEEKMRKKL